MPAKRMRSSIVVAITTPPAPPLGMRETPASVALEFVTNEHRLIRSMIAEFLGRQGVREQEDLTQDLWMHLNGRLQRAIQMHPEILSQVLLLADPLPAQELGDHRADETEIGRASCRERV